MNRLASSSLLFALALSLSAPAWAQECTPTLKWEYSDSGLAWITPLVIDVTGTSAPEIITIFGDGTQGKIVVLSSSGVLLGESTVLVSDATLAAADLEPDGKVDIVALSPANEILVFNFMGGAVVNSWGTGPLSVRASAPQIGIANLDQAGHAEIYFEGTVVTTVPTVHTAPAGTGRGVSTDTKEASFVTAADVRSPPGLELVAGNGIYSFDPGNPSLTVLGTFPIGDGGTSVADVDLDGEPDILHVFSKLAEPDLSTLSLLDPSDFTVRGSISYTQPLGYNVLASPLVAQLDDTELPEIVVTLRDQLEILNWDDSLPDFVTVRTVSPTNDESGVVSPTAFDFAGSGELDIVYADHDNLHLIDGNTGVSDFTTPNPSLTGYESAYVADIDEDCLPEIIAHSSTRTGSKVRVFDCDANVPTRRIWNQHGYHYTQVRDDGLVPVVEPEHWNELNTVLAQHGPCVLRGVPDAVTIECGEDLPAPPVVLGSEGCAVFVPMMTEEELSSCPGERQVLRTWTAQDACGYVTTATQVITQECCLCATYDFEGQAMGDVITTEFAGLDFSDTVPDVVVFDTGSPSCDDDDLATPGGDGNDIARGHVLVLQEASSSCSPDDEEAGGTFVIRFDEPNHVQWVGILDVDADEVGGTIQPCDATGFGDIFPIPAHVDNGWQAIDIDLEAVDCLEVTLAGSGALTDIVCQ